MTFPSARRILTWDSIRLMTREVQQDIWCTLTGPNPRPNEPTWRITRINPWCPTHGTKEGAAT